MSRKPNAAVRTVELLPGIRAKQDNHAPKMVDVDGPKVKRVSLSQHFGKEGTDEPDGPYIAPSLHYRFGKESRYTLCDLLVTSYDPVVDTKDLGTCQKCRAEASKRRMVVVT